MRFFYDTEFWERGSQHPIELISIGIVAENGDTLYLENMDFDWSRESINDWLRNNVHPHLVPGHSLPILAIGEQIKCFVNEHGSPNRYDNELWAYYSAYDHVLLCQLFGSMINLPSNIPMFTHDLKQLMISRGVGTGILPKIEGTEHNALSDAAWVKQAYETITSTRPC